MSRFLRSLFSSSSSSLTEIYACIIDLKRTKGLEKILTTRNLEAWISKVEQATSSFWKYQKLIKEQILQKMLSEESRNKN